MLLHLAASVVDENLGRKTYRVPRARSWVRNTVDHSTHNRIHGPDNASAVGSTDQSPVMRLAKQVVKGDWEGLQEKSKEALAKGSTALT